MLDETDKKEIARMIAEYTAQSNAELTTEQQKQLASLQKTFDGTVAELKAELQKIIAPIPPSTPPSIPTKRTESADPFGLFEYEVDEETEVA